MRIVGGKRCSGYHLASIGQKQALARLRIAPRAQLVRCEVCWTGLLERDLLAHRADRCPGAPLVGRAELSKRTCK